MNVRVKNARRGRLRLAFGVHLEPGVNEVNAASWVRCREHPVTLHYMNRGEVAVVPESGSVVTPSVGTRVRSEQTPDPAPANYEPESPPLPLEDGGASEQVIPIPPAPDAPSLSDMRAKEAIGVVTEIDDRHRLQHLLRLERRSTVVRAIERRLAEIGD